FCFFVSCYHLCLPSAGCLSVFFFLSYGDHRPPHSFPTRRSSDLHYFAESIRILKSYLLKSILFLFRSKNIRIGTEEYPDSLIQLDRKSTRLNSSHVKISYAVFCLKKKKDINKLKSIDCVKRAAEA